MAKIPPKGFPLGPADLQHPDGVDAMLAARGRYLEAIEDHAPCVLVHLAGDPLALARRVHGWTAELLNAPLSPLASGDGFEWATISHPGYDGDPERVALRRSLAAWGARYGFLPRPGDGPGYDWGLDNALETLGHWIAAGDRFNPQQPTWERTPGTAAYRPMGTLKRERVGPGIGRAVEGVLVPAETKITFPAIHWNPQHENEAAFRRRVRENLSDMLAPEIARIRSLAESQLSKAPRKHNDDHFVWAVWYQVDGLIWEQVADRVSKEPGSVSREVQELGRLMRLPLRSGRPGRPRRNL